MTRSRVLTAIGFGAVIALPAQAFAQRIDNSQSRRINEMAEYGQLREAEIAARIGGPQVTVTLGDVLVLRGRLVAADSVYRLAVANHLPAYRSADAALAELALRHGDRVDAARRASGITGDYEKTGAQWSPEDVVAAGRAYVVLGAVKPSAFHDALAAFDRAAAADSSNLDARLRAADMLLDKYNAPDARDSYEQVLERQPDQPRALLGLARALSFEGHAEATDAVRKKSCRQSGAPVPAYLLLRGTARRGGSIRFRSQRCLTRALHRFIRGGGVGRDRRHRVAARRFGGIQTGAGCGAEASSRNHPSSMRRLPRPRRDSGATPTRRRWPNLQCRPIHSRRTHTASSA